MSGSGNNTGTSGPDKTAGQYHSMKGSVVETIGNVTGAETWQRSGRDEHARGEAEYNAAQVQGLAEGTGERLAGYKDSVVGSIAGDAGQQASGNVQQEKGKAQQQSNKPWSSS